MKYFYGVNGVIHPTLSYRSQKANQTKQNKTNNMSPSNQPLSIYIPRVFPNITKARIAAIFQSLDLGEVRQVDLVPRTNQAGESYNMAFIHMRSWCESAASTNFQEKVLDAEREARVVYDDPWYWIVLENRNPKSDAQLIVEQRLEVLEEAVAHLRMRCDGLETENDFYREALGEYLMDDDDENQTLLQEPYQKEDGWRIVEDDEGNEFYVFDPTAEDLMPQRENSDGGAPASPRLPAGFRRPVRSGAVEGFDYETALQAENDALAMTGALGAKNNRNTEVEEGEIPPWMYSDGSTLSWQQLHEEAERFRQEYVAETATSSDFIPRHPSECPPISLPLQEGQVEINPTDGSFNLYSNVNGEHIWTPIPEKNLTPAVIAEARERLAQPVVPAQFSDDIVSRIALEVQRELALYATGTCPHDCEGCDDPVERV